MTKTPTKFSMDIWKSEEEGVIKTFGDINGHDFSEMIKTLFAPAAKKAENRGEGCNCCLAWSILLYCHSSESTVNAVFHHQSSNYSIVLLNYFNNSSKISMISSIKQQLPQVSFHAVLNLCIGTTLKTSSQE